MSDKWDELKDLINKARQESHDKKIATLEQLADSQFEMTLSKEIEFTETEEYLEIKGTKEMLEPFTQYLKSMELLDPGDNVLMDPYVFIVSPDGTPPDSSKKDQYFMMPADDWLMMGCKLAEALYGYESNPYTFYGSPFGNGYMSYAIRIHATDLKIDDDTLDEN